MDKRLEKYLSREPEAPFFYKIRAELSVKALFLFKERDKQI